jgi:predicted nucleic acid binding AN1-type Zn finger protein
MEDVKSKRCEASGCTKLNPAFNALGETRGRFCAEHRLPGMEDVMSRRCKASGCARQPNFNTPGETRGRF